MYRRIFTKKTAGYSVVDVEGKDFEALVIV
jgi:hypothetical protein